MHLTPQTLTVIGLLFLGIPGLIITCFGLYYRLQAGTNLKPGSKWQGWTRPAGSIPPSEFTQLGLYYRRRAYIWTGVFVAWVFVIIIYFAVASSLARPH